MGRSIDNVSERSNSYMLLGLVVWLVHGSRNRRSPSLRQFNPAGRRT